MLEKKGSQTPSQRSGSTDEHQKHEFVDNGGDERLDKKPKKSFWQKLNPFLAGEVPPVPSADAGLVPDLHANFWSKLTWGWMGPLMMVSEMTHCVRLSKSVLMKGF